MEITVIGIIDFGGVTSAFECYLYSARKVDNTGYSSLISNAHKLKKYILITMNCCKKQLLLPLEGDGLTGDDIILLFSPILTHNAAMRLHHQSHIYNRGGVWVHPASVVIN